MAKRKDPKPDETLEVRRALRKRGAEKVTPPTEEEARRIAERAIPPEKD
jgi:hypothetical protein